MDSKACVVCETSSNLKVCSGCNTIVYCSRKCQNLDWGHNDHKLICDIIQQIGGAPKRKRNGGGYSGKEEENEEEDEDTEIVNPKRKRSDRIVNLLYILEQDDNMDEMLNLDYADILIIFNTNEFERFLDENESFLRNWLERRNIIVDGESQDDAKNAFLNYLTLRADELVEEGVIDEFVYNSLYNYIYRIYSGARGVFNLLPSIVQKFFIASAVIGILLGVTYLSQRVASYFGIYFDQTVLYNAFSKARRALTNFDNAIISNQPDEIVDGSLRDLEVAYRALRALEDPDNFFNNLLRYISRTRAFFD